MEAVASHLESTFGVEIKKLLATEGWNVLSNKQREMILMTLRCQTKANEKDPESQEFVERMFCHSAVRSLETGRFPNSKLDGIPLSDFFEAKFDTYRTVEGLSRFVNKLGFPVVAHVGNYPRLPFLHTFLILGHDETDNLLVWGKKGLGLSDPFYVDTLQKEFEFFGPTKYWGVRKLKNTTSNS